MLDYRILCTKEDNFNFSLAPNIMNYFRVELELGIKVKISKFELSNLITGFLPGHFNGASQALWLTLKIKTSEKLLF